MHFKQVRRQRDDDDCRFLVEYLISRLQKNREISYKNSFIDLTEHSGGKQDGSADEIGAQSLGTNNYL